MKKTLLFFIVLLFTTICFSQDCKFRNFGKSDDKSNLPVLIQKDVIQFTLFTSSCCFFYSTNRCCILFNLITIYSIYSERSFNTRTPIVFIFNDSSKLQLFPSNEEESNQFFSLESGFLSEKGTLSSYSISKENVAQIVSKEISKIRIYYSPINSAEEIKDSSLIPLRYVDLKLSSNRIEDFKRLSKCILQVDFQDPDTCNNYKKRSIAKFEETNELTNTGWVNQTDSSKFSTIYFLYNDGQDESQSFPIYFNDNYIFTLKNHMRLTYKMYSYGTLSIKRKANNKVGPITKLKIQNGESYGVSIKLPYPREFNLGKRFVLIIKKGSNLDEFMKNEFYKFKPFKNCDIKMHEDINKPIKY